MSAFQIVVLTLLVIGVWLLGCISVRLSYAARRLDYVVIALNLIHTELERAKERWR